MGLNYVEVGDQIITWGPGGGSTTRIWEVEGLAPCTYPFEVAAQILAGVNTITPFPPTFATPHPSTICRNMYASDYVARPISTSKDKGYLEARYNTPTAAAPLGGVCIDFAGSNGQWIKNRWEAGAQKGQIILVGYGFNQDGTPMTFPNQIDPNIVAPSEAGQGAWAGAQFDTVQLPVENPNAIFTLTRMEFGTVQTPGIPPYFPYRRSINATPWLGFAKETVLLHDIRSRYVFGTGLVPNHFVSQYIFEAAVDPMYIEYYVTLFRDPDNSFIPGVNILDGTNNGYTWVGLYQDQDFNQLGFNLSGI